MNYESLMRLSLDLAEKGFGSTRSNPMVGAVLCDNDGIIGYGYHRKYGSYHAEVEALIHAQTLGHSSRVKDSTLFVTLEPCNHTGKTPPCVEAILNAQIKKVVCATVDPNQIVAGTGIKRLIENNIVVQIGVLDNQARTLNKRFFTFHEKKRPYIILKWAQTQDGFIAKPDHNSKWISCEKSREKSHQWRAQEQAILVGSKTAVFDNPKLNSRTNSKVEFQPLRILIDLKRKVPLDRNIFSKEQETLLLAEDTSDIPSHVTTLAVSSKQNFELESLLEHLVSLNISSLIVEGGTYTLNKFLNQNLYDELRVFVAPTTFGRGIPSPMATDSLFQIAQDISVIEREDGRFDTLLFC
jgi:diaminohydroxyphosphoribosylaminopyrimidine deaminase / 5-amino-6-(5-phosphoribosylamino)uracil reductase